MGASRQQQPAYPLHGAEARQGSASVSLRLQASGDTLRMRERRSAQQWLRASNPPMGEDGAMMNKSHGPSLRKERIDLAQCSACRGKAVIKGVFHEMACVQCNASGWVEALTGNALPVDELVTQLNFKLQAAQRQINELRNPRATGPEATYQNANRLGAGGSNYTGD